MRVLGLAVFLLLTSSVSIAKTSETETPSGAFVWSGFSHSWDYNHRLSRFGDYVSGQPCSGASSTCSAKVVHSAASGLGPDTAKAKSSWWQVQSTKVGFATATTKLSIAGKEGTDIEMRKTVRIPLQRHALAAARDRKNYVALLNGFDLIAKDDADKLVKLSISPTIPHYNKQHNALVFKLRVLANLACSTPECPKNDNTTANSFRVDTVVIAGDSSLEVTNRNFKRTYSWPDQSASIQTECGLNFDAEQAKAGAELALDPLEASIKGSSSAPHALLAFKSLAVSLADERHMIRLDAAIDPQRYDGRQYKFALDLLFKNWAKDMETKHSPFSLCSFGEPGRASWSSQIALVQLPSSAKVSHHSADCRIKWPGLNKDNSDATCTRKESFRLS